VARIDVLQCGLRSRFARIDALRLGLRSRWLGLMFFPWVEV